MFSNIGFTLSLYNLIILGAGIVLIILGATFIKDGLDDAKNKNRVMLILDTALGVGLVVIGIGVIVYVLLFM
jgi:hypothetical protein